MNKSEFNSLPEKERVRTLEGTAFYTHIHNPDMQSAKRFNATPQYHTSLGLDDKGVKLAKSFGLTVKEPNEYIPMPFVKIKRNVKDLTNPKASQPDLVDSMQQPVPNGVLIGNGSKARVKFGTYWYDNQGGGVGTAMFKFQVTDLVPYEGASDPDMVIDEDGWIADGSSLEDIPTAVGAFD
jgi:hypothetical protein